MRRWAGLLMVAGLGFLVAAWACVLSGRDLRSADGCFAAGSALFARGAFCQGSWLAGAMFAVYALLCAWRCCAPGAGGAAAAAAGVF